MTKKAKAKKSFYLVSKIHIQRQLPVLQICSAISWCYEGGLKHNTRVQEAVAIYEYTLQILQNVG